MKDREAQYWDTMQKRHGVAQVTLRSMLESQNNTCALCPTMGNPEIRMGRLQLDHCHETYKVRQFLCSSCNNRVKQIERGCGPTAKKSDRYDRTPYLAYIERHKKNGT